MQMPTAVAPLTVDDLVPAPPDDGPTRYEQTYAVEAVAVALRARRDAIDQRLRPLGIARVRQQTWARNHRQPHVDDPRFVKLSEASAGLHAVLWGRDELAQEVPVFGILRGETGVERRVIAPAVAGLFELITGVRSALAPEHVRIRTAQAQARLAALGDRTDEAAVAERRTLERDLRDLAHLARHARPLRDHLATALERQAAGDQPGGPFATLRAIYLGKGVPRPSAAAEPAPQT